MRKRVYCFTVTSEAYVMPFNASSLLICAISVLCCSAPASAVDFREERTIKVIDQNDRPVSGARVYEFLKYDWVNHKLSPDQNYVAETDNGGVAKYILTSSSRPIIIIDPSTDNIAVCMLSRKQNSALNIVRLTRLAWIHVRVNIPNESESDLKVRLNYNDIEKRRSYRSFIELDLPFDKSPNVISIPSPSDCHLIFEVTGNLIKPIDIQISPLKDGEDRDIGTLDILPVSHYKYINNSAPNIADSLVWVQGESIDFGKLNNNIVLLDFWGLWCGPCRRAFPELIRLHETYQRDGLIIVAIHDSSCTKQDLMNADIEGFSVSDIPFAIAIDTPVVHAIRGEVSARPSAPCGVL